MKNRLIFFLTFILFSSLVVGVGTNSQYSFNVLELPTFNNNTAFVNESAHWVTKSIGTLDDANSTQFNGDGGVLSIIEPWVDSLWCRKTGCTMSGNISLNGNSITNILSTQYDISGCSDTTQGTFCYDTTYDTMRFVTISGQILQMNQETTMPIKNIEGSNVADGSIVYIVGATGSNPNFKLAKADNLSTAALVGVVTKACNNNQICPVVFFGLIHEFNTSIFAAGDHLYISQTEAGNFTTTPPEFPNVPIWVATVVRVHATEGTIFVFPRLDSANGITINNLGLVGDFIQTDYKIMSLPGNDAISQNVFAIEMNGTTGIDIPHLILQPGGPGQASAWVRSGMVVPESVTCLNTTNRTEPLCFADEGNFTWEILNFNTSLSEGADWGITGELEVIKDAYIHGNLTIVDRLFMTDASHWIKRGAIGFDGLASNTFALQHGEEHPQGTITFVVTANKTNSDTDAVSIMAQVGLNNSGGYLGNSWMVAPNNLTTNLTDLSNCFFVINATNNIPKISCDTGDTGADLFVQDDIQAGGTMFADGGIRAETLANFIMNGNDAQINNGSLHIFTAVDFISGVTAGDEVVKFNEFFSGSLISFVNLQDDIGNWFATSNVLCDDGDCANALGISGVGSIQMGANLSTSNINSTKLNFVYSLVNMLGADSFSVIVENSTTSTTVFTDSTNNVIKSSQSIDISAFNNQSDITIIFDCDVTQPNRQCFVDTIKVNGTAIQTTLTNQSGFNSQICFGDGTRDILGVCNTGIFFNASLNTVFPQGNWNFSDVSIGGVDHSATTKLEWAVAGHTFSSAGQIMNIGSYNLITTGKIISGSLTITTANDGDSINVSGVNNLFTDTTGGDVTITGFVGGLRGQKIYIANTIIDNDVTLQHNASVAQDIFLNSGDDDILNNEYGGWILIFDGTSWFESAHAL